MTTASDSNKQIEEIQNKADSYVVDGFEDIDKEDNRLPFILSKREFKLLLIAGVGFFLDAYDLFIINPVSTMLKYRLYGGHSLPAGLEGFLKAGANIGSVIGQFLFGYFGDSIGRKAVYGKELVVIIVATILCISVPTNILSPDNVLIWLACFRILLGIGVGGDYPLSASVATDRVRLRRRGVLLGYVFASQGWGSLIGSVVTIIVLLCYRHVMETEGQISKVDGAWRICIGISLIPAFVTFYQRMKLPESKRYTAMKAAVTAEKAQRASSTEKELVKPINALSITTLKSVTSETAPINDQESEKAKEEVNIPSAASIPDPERLSANEKLNKGNHLKDVIAYFSEWRHAKLLIGTSMTWFLVDIAFYGINLNQNVVLSQIGFGGTGGSAWHNLFEIATGNVIITALGFLPGYYVTVLTVEYLGRKFIQIQGFLMTALFLGILAGKFHTLSTGAFCVCFAFLQFFFNFGANGTTFLYPAEVFPTRYRSFAHGLSAAAGKAGAIISSLGFNPLSKKIGTPAVLWIFFGTCILGALFTLLLPEVKGRDPDAIDAEERKAARKVKEAKPNANDAKEVIATRQV